VDFVVYRTPFQRRLNQMLVLATFTLILQASVMSVMGQKGHFQIANIQLHRHRCRRSAARQRHFRSTVSHQVLGSGAMWR
jgi:hypothetical protein